MTYLAAAHNADFHGPRLFNGRQVNGDQIPEILQEKCRSALRMVNLSGACSRN